MADAGADTADIYMYFVPAGDIEGETTDHVMSEFKAFQVKEFELEAKNEENIGGANPNPGAKGANKGAGKVKFDAVKITKWTDRATPGLFQACGSGSTLPEAVIVFRRSGGSVESYRNKTPEHRVFMTINLYQCTISSVSIKASDDEELMDEVSVDFGSIRIEYFKQAPRGSARGAMTDRKVANWSRVTSSTGSS